MSIIYLPIFIKDSDYQLLNWLDKHNGRSEICFNLIDSLNINIYKLEDAILRLEKGDFLNVKREDCVIVGIALTQSAQTFLAEHILGKKRLIED